MTESDLYPAIIGEYSNGPTRLWRQQSMLAWAGKVIARTANSITLAHPHAIKFGMPGIADIGGLTSVVITPAMVGSVLAQAIAIECKWGRARPTEEQAAYIALVNRLGGRAGVARSVEDAGRIIWGESHP